MVGGLHLSQRHRLGLVLSLIHPRRLLALRHRLESLRQHAGEGITDTLDIALAALGCDGAKVLHKRRLLSDNGSSCIAADLADYLEDNGMKHAQGAPMHPQTQGKIERWHQTIKNRCCWRMLIRR